MKKRWVLWLVVGVVILVFASCLILNWSAGAYRIASGAMAPALELQDQVLVDKLSFRLGAQPQRGDIVTLDDPTGEYPQLIFRVIAVGGDTIDLMEGQVYLNGELLDEPYVHGKPTYPAGGLPLPAEIAQGSVFVMGDNRTNSTDGRFFGPVSVDTVTGRVFRIY